MQGLNSGNTRAIDIVPNGVDTASLTSMNDLSGKGINTGEDGTFSQNTADGWTSAGSSTDAAGTSFGGYTNEDLDLTLAVESAKTGTGV